MVARKPMSDRDKFTAVNRGFRPELTAEKFARMSLAEVHALIEQIRRERNRQLALGVGRGLLWLVRSASHLIRQRRRQTAKQDLIAIAGERKSFRNGGDHLSAQPHTIIRSSFAVRRLRAAQAAAMRLGQPICPLDLALGVDRLPRVTPSIIV
jgi:hypothetical protein